LDNVVLSPHLAGADETSSVAMSVEAADNIVKLSKHEWPVGAVINHVLQDNWSWER
jgi:phosphoglycerate dehydrogenase-like enzyme